MFMENLYSRYKIHLGNAEKNLKTQQISYNGNTFSAFTNSHGVSFQLFEEDKGLYKDKTRFKIFQKKLQNKNQLWIGT